MSHKTPDAQFDKLGSLWFSEWTYFGAFCGALCFFGTIIRGSFSNYAISGCAIGQYNFSLPIKHLSWAHNLILLQQVKDIRARYWYMVQSITSHWSKRYQQEDIKLNDYGKHGVHA